MVQKDEWVSAADALKVLAARFSAQSAAMRICERAHAGLIRARAEQFQIGERAFRDHEVPKEFWWAEGHEALEQDWAAGDFSTWIDRRVHWKAFGVTFSRVDLEKLAPPGAPAPSEEEKQDERLYLRIGHLVETAPDFTISATPDMRLWIAQARAVVKETSDVANMVAFETAMGLYFGPPAAPLYGSKLVQCVYNALADAGSNVSSSLRGAFIPAGNAHDAVAAVVKILGEAKRRVMLVDPYADAALLERYALFVPEGVVVDVLADVKDVKPTLKPAAEAWLTQYATSRPLSVRVSPARALHDRLIILDEAIAFTVGQSFNALASRAPTSINRIMDAETARRKIEAHLQIWDSAPVLA